MKVRFSRTQLPDVILVEPFAFQDSRGFFLETYHYEKYAEGGIGCTFVQDNRSHSCRNALRGLHYQLKHPQAKLVFVVRGEIVDVAVDIRTGSPTFGQWVAVSLSGSDHRQLFIPEGFAHGFAVISEEADVCYKCSDFYAQGDEYGIVWNDPELAIHWPLSNPVLSAKDQAYPRLKDVRPEYLPVYSG